MKPRFGNGGVKGTRQRDDTPLSDAPLVFAKGMTRREKKDQAIAAELYRKKKGTPTYSFHPGGKAPFGKAEDSPSRGEPSSGRVGAGYFLSGPHGLVAGRKGHKLRAAGREIGESMLAAAPGAVIGELAARRASPVGSAAGQALGLAGGLAGGVHAVRANNLKGRYKAEPGGRRAWNSKVTDAPVGKGIGMAYVKAPAKAVGESLGPVLSQYNPDRVSRMTRQSNKFFARYHANGKQGPYGELGTRAQKVADSVNQRAGRPHGWEVGKGVSASARSRQIKHAAVVVFPATVGGLVGEAHGLKRGTRSGYKAGIVDSADPDKYMRGAVKDIRAQEIARSKSKFGKGVSVSAIARLRGTGRNPFPSFQQGPGAEVLGNRFRRQGRTALADRAGRLQVATSDRAAHAAGRVKNEFQPKLSSYQSSGVGKGLMSALKGTKKIVPLPERPIPKFAVKGGWRDARLDAREEAASDRGRLRAKLSKAEVSKSRHFDPEHRRQQRLGAATALLAVGGGVAGTKGVKGALKTTRELKAIKVRPSGFVKPGDTDSTVGQHRLMRRVGAVSAKDASWAAGGLGGAGGAAAVQSHANSRRGKAWD